MNETVQHLPLIAQKKLRATTPPVPAGTELSSFSLELHVEETPRSKIELKGTKQREKTR